MAVFQIYIPKKGDFRILLKLNNTVEFVSKSFSCKTECLQAIRLIRSNCKKDFFYSIKTLNCGSWYFICRQPNNNEFLGRSTTYRDESTILLKLSAMKSQAFKAELDSRALRLN